MMSSRNLIERCSVGKRFDSACFLTRYVKENLNLYNLEDLDEDTRQTIHYRTNMKEIPSICSHHRAAYSTRFKAFKTSKKCDNPFGTHLKTKRPLGICIVLLSSCVKVSLKKTNLHIYPGQRLCLNCYQQLELLVSNVNEKELTDLECLQGNVNFQQDLHSASTSVESESPSVINDTSDNNNRVTNAVQNDKKIESQKILKKKTSIPIDVTSNQSKSKNAKQSQQKTAEKVTPIQPRNINPPLPCDESVETAGKVTPIQPRIVIPAVSCDESVNSDVELHQNVDTTKKTTGKGTRYQSRITKPLLPCDKPAISDVESFDFHVPTKKFAAVPLMPHSTKTVILCDELTMNDGESHQNIHMTRNAGESNSTSRYLSLNNSTSHLLADAVQKNSMLEKEKHLKEKKKEYQHKYLEKVKKRKNESVPLNAHNEPLSTDMKYPPSGEQMQNAETDVVAALMTLVTNTGLGRFSDTSTLMDNWQAAAALDSTTPPPPYICNLIKEIDNNVTEADMGRIIEEFQQSWNIEARLFACASCGMKAFEMGADQSHTISIEELTSLLMSESDREDLLSIPLKYRAMASYYQSTNDGQYYHLHREFVRSEPAASSDGGDMENATLCSPCYDAAIHGKKIPTLSLAAGIDFGNADRLFLPKLSLAEEYVLATSRLFVLIIKLAGYQHAERQSGKLGHAIVFPQYGQQLETEIRKARVERHTGTFPCLDNLFDSLSIAFVGSDLQWAALVANKSHRAFKPIRVRSEVIYMWLSALKACNSRYRDIVIDESDEMQAALESIPDQLIERTTVVGDESEIQVDRLVHQQAETPDTRNEVNTDDQLTDDPTTYPMSFLTRSGCPEVHETSASGAVFQSLASSVAEAHNAESEDIPMANGHSTEEASHTKDTCINIEQSAEPLNEFEQNDHLLYSAFPHLFPLGKGLRRTSGVPQKDVYHMENQWHGKFAKCLRFQFLLFDQLQRHSAARAVKASVLSNAVSMTKFSEMISDPSFMGKLEWAKNHPNAPESETLLAQLMPHISLVNRKVPYSAAERRAAVGHLMNMVRYYGPPSIFNTVSPDDIHGMLNIRLTLNLRDNVTFPAIEDGLAEALRHQQTEFHSIPIHPSALRILLAEGPAFAANMYYKMSTSIFVHLFGTPPDNFGKKKSIPLTNRKPGIFGTPIASFGCTEEQNRGSLHMHSLFWGGLTPALLQAVGGIKVIAQHIATAINRVVMAQLQPLVHVRHLLRDLRNESPAHAALFRCNNLIRDKLQFLQDFQRTVDLSNVHQHGPSCFKTKAGKRCCRFGYAVPLRDQTGMEQIVPVDVTNKAKPEISFRVLDDIQPPAATTTTRRNYSRIPVAFRDNRMIMNHLKRPAIPMIRSPSFQQTDPPTAVLHLPEDIQQQFDALTVPEQEKVNRALVGRNGLVVEYSPVQSALVGCNTNASMLGSDAQTKAALCYVLKYVTKPPAELAHSLSLLHHARRTIELHPSKAADSGSVIRTGMHFLNRIVNQLNGAIEISAPMAAVAIQGMPAELCSDGFWVAYVTAAVTYAKRHPEASSTHSDETVDQEFDDLEAADSPLDDAQEEVANAEENIIDESDDSSTKEEENINENVNANTDEMNENVAGEETVTNNIRETEATADDFFTQIEPLILSPEEQHRLTTQSDEAVVSTATIYVSDKKIVAVPQHVHYAYRGANLTVLSLFEYVALIDVIPKHWTKTHTPKGEDEPDLGGREFNATFDFVPAHPLHDTHVQRIRSKTKIPVLVGPPPQPPISKPVERTVAWTNQARKFADYFLTLYRPWSVETGDGGTLPGSTRWNDLCRYMRVLDHGSNDQLPSFLDRIRCKWITNAAHGLRIAGEDRTAASKYRCQAATVWNTKDGTESLRSTLDPQEGSTLLSNEVRIQETMAATAAQENINILRDKASADDLLERANHSHFEYYQATEFALRRLFEPTEQQRASVHSVTSANQMLRSEEHSADMSSILAQLRADVIHPPCEDGNDDIIVPGPWTSNKRVPEGTRLSDQLNSSQKVIWNLANDYFEQLRKFKDGQAPKPTPFRLLVHGGPGTGKSFLAECIQEAAAAQKFTVACVAPTGIAASNLPNGRTMHNFASIPMFHDTRIFLPKLNALKLSTVQERAQHETMACKIIDEISFVGPEMFAQDESRMKQIMGNDDTLGGVATIIMGDFNQLPPVAPAESLYAALLKSININAPAKANTASTGPTTQGARLFSEFRKIELTQQMRAQNDPGHIAFLNKLRSASSDPQTRSMDTINRLKIISRDDVDRDPSWLNAPIVVTSNEERYRINEHQSLMLAKKQNCPRIVWFQPIIGIVANGLDQNQTNYLYATSPQFKGIFVAGAPGFLMSNINPKRGLTNGTPVTFHSLVLDPREDRERLIAAITEGNGEDVILQYNPKHVLVKITNADPADFVGLTAVEGDAVIPLSQTHTSKAFAISVPGKLNKIKLQTTSYGIDLGFSVTLHKIQGQTCSKLIVDLNHRPFMPQITFPGLYVAVSRVRRAEDLRIMPIQPSSKNLKFLTTLQPSKKLITWMKGYDAHGDWDSKRVPCEPPLATEAGKRPKRATSSKRPVPSTASTNTPPAKTRKQTATKTTATAHKDAPTLQTGTTTKRSSSSRPPINEPQAKQNKKTESNPPTCSTSSNTPGQKRGQAAASPPPSARSAPHSTNKQKPLRKKK